MSQRQRSVRGSIASDEDATRAYVLVDRAALTLEAARSVLIELAREDWNMVVPEDVRFIKRQWFRWRANGEELIQCGGNNPQRDSEWWVFDVAECESR